MSLSRDCNRCRDTHLVYKSHELQNTDTKNKCTGML